MYRIDFATFSAPLWKQAWIHRQSLIGPMSEEKILYFERKSIENEKFRYENELEQSF